MKLRLIDCPPFTYPKQSYKPGDCWYARDGGWACRVCGCRWRENPPTEVQPDGSWSLFDADQVPGMACCDNVTMDLVRVWFWWSNNDRTVTPAAEHEGKRAMIVVLPTGPAFCLHQSTYKDGTAGPTGWKIEGELPNVTVYPSINYGDSKSPSPYDWHGSIRNGLMT